MSKFKYLKISRSKKLRYLILNKKSNLFIIFLHGFKSDLEGAKPKNFVKFCRKNNLGFIGIEYSGHGKSSGNFTSGNISIWSKEVKLSIKKLIKEKNFIFIGSSMGAWISLNQFKYFKNQIKGFIGIAPAPEFLDKLMWNKFPKKIKNEITTKGIYNLSHGGYEYPITHQLIKDGKKNKILHRRFKQKIPIVMIHGKKDEVVPTTFSKKVLKVFKTDQKKLCIIKGGDHSLSKKHNLKKINKELLKIVSNLN